MDSIPNSQAAALFIATSSASALFNATLFEQTPRLKRFFNDHACFGIDQHQFSYQLSELDGSLIDIREDAAFDTDEGSDCATEYL